MSQKAIIISAVIIGVLTLVAVGNYFIKKEKGFLNVNTVFADPAPSTDPTKNVEYLISNLISQMTVDEKCNILHGSDMFESPGISRLNIDGFHMSDGPQGVRFATGTTAFPASIALAATWDPAYNEVIGAAYGREHKGAGKNMALGPAVDIGRDPRNGRASETIGEEPFLGGKVMAGFARGIQSNNLIGCVKHFMAQNHDGPRTETSPMMDARTMREFYGLPFRTVVQEGEIYSVMSAYNLVNKIHCSQNQDMLNQMLKTEWGYKYFVVSDWWGAYDNADVLMNAGLDMEMPNNAKFNGLIDAVNSGKISQETLDMAVRRTMRSRYASGMMDPSTPKGNPADIGSDENRKINLEAGKKAIVLLKNSDNILPLKKTGTIALIGPNADTLPITSFGSSEITNPKYKVSTRQGISNVAPSVNVIYAKGCDMNSADQSQFDEALNAAKKADVVVFVGGLDNTQEGEAYDQRANMDRTGMSVMIPGQQNELIKRLAQVNPNIVVVLQSGGIVSLGSNVENIKSILYAWYCGSEGGDAIAQALFGDYNPGGKLPISMPTGDDQLPVWDNLDFTNDMISGFGYRRFDKSGEKPLFNFGHGLSYTTFAYSNLKVSTDQVDGKDGLLVSVDVTNTGAREGDEVAQLYLSYNLSVLMPIKQLRGFKRITIKPGETQTVHFNLTAYELSYWSIEFNQYYVEKGTYIAKVGGSSDNLVLNTSFQIINDFKIPYPTHDPIPPPTPTPTGKSFYFTNTDIKGADLTNTPAQVPTMCFDFCYQTNGCNAFTWTNYNGGTCWLKSNSDNKLALSGGYSGALCKLENNKDISGPVIGTASDVSNPEECCTICAQIEKCGAFAWNNYNGGTCWFKEKSLGTKDSEGVVGFSG